MHIETALAKSSTTPRRQDSQIHIHKGLAYLRASSKHWTTVQGTLHMLEEIVSKTGLTLDGLDHHKFDLSFLNPFALDQNKPLDGRIDRGSRLVGPYEVFAGDRAFSNDKALAWTSFPSPLRPPMAYTGVTYGTRVADEDPQNCLNDLLAENVLEFDGMHQWGEFV